jgi:A nuclease of the HNH/ENDO VII superfamily with conserved WHH
MWAYQKGKSGGITYKSKDGTIKTGADAVTQMHLELEASVGAKNIVETVIDEQGRVSCVVERPDKSFQVVSVHETSSGRLKMTTFEPAYNPALNTNIPVPLSKNKLVPDYEKTSYLHPLNDAFINRNNNNTDKKGLEITMTGDRNTDIKAANEALGYGSVYDTPTFIKPDGTVVKYTWHHLDDFRIVNGKPTCTMQLVETKAHGGSGVSGMSHSGSVAQYKAFYENVLNTPNNKFY